MFVGVTGRGHDADLESAKVDDRIFGEGCVIKADVRVCAGADDGVGFMRDFAIAGDKVCVQVGVEDMRQRKTKLGSGMQVPVHVAKRVDQNPLFGFVRADQVGGVAESCIDEWLNEKRSGHVEIITL